jgi:hypothetical protein
VQLHVKKVCKKQTEHINCHDTPGLKPHQCRFYRKSLFTDVSVKAIKDFSRLGKIVGNGVWVKRRQKTPLFVRNSQLNRPPAFISDGF